MTLSSFIDAVPLNQRTLRVFNDDEPEPLVRMLRQMVDSPSVDVGAGDATGGRTNVVVVEDGAGNELAVSSISDISRCVLLVNSDLYTTGTRSLDEVDTPAVLLHLDGVPFTVTGKQKMLLIELSRYIESLGWRTDGGTVHSGFQYLSRIDDERGTRRVYDRLAGSDADLHVYGLPDRVPGLDGDVTVHDDATDELRESWFVVTTGCDDEAKAALLAERTASNEWRGCWTFDADRVDEVAAYLRDRYAG